MITKTHSIPMGKHFSHWAIFENKLCALLFLLVCKLIPAL